MTVVCIVGLERYWHWGIGYSQYFPVLGSIGYWAILLLVVIPNINTAWTRLDTSCQQMTAGKLGKRLSKVMKELKMKFNKQ